MYYGYKGSILYFKGYQTIGFRTAEGILFKNAFSTNNIDGNMTILQIKQTGMKQLGTAVQDLTD
jgi:hypothetical protein